MNGRPFDGITYDTKRDGQRLGAQLDAVRDFLVKNRELWFTLEELSVALHFPEASISARLRDLRKEKFGGHVIDRAYMANGQWAYSMRGLNELF